MSLSSLPLVERAELARLLSPDSPGLPRNSDGDRDLFLPTSIAAIRSYTISTTVPFQSLLQHQGHVTRGSGIKIKILRLALTGSNPEYPPGPDPASILCSDSTRTKNRRRQRVTGPEFHTPASGASAP